VTALGRGHPLSETYHSRVAQNQDFSVIVSDHHNRRGTGKTVLSLKLAAAMDRTEEGLTSEKVSLSPEELAAAYIDQPRGSALVLDEAEAGLSKYRAGSSANMAMRQLVSMGRIEEKYLVMNLPAAGELDRDLQALCDWSTRDRIIRQLREETDLTQREIAAAVGLSRSRVASIATAGD